MNSKWYNRTDLESIQYPFSACFVSLIAFSMLVYNSNLDLMGLHDVCFALALSESQSGSQ